MEVILEGSPFPAFQRLQAIRSESSKESSKCIHRSSAQQYFCEVYQLTYITPRIRAKITAEVKAHSAATVANLAGLHKCFLYEEEGSRKAAILSPFAAPSLKALLSENKGLPAENDLIQVMRQTAKIVCALHNKGVTHGNIKLETVFYSAGEKKVTLGRPRLRQIDKHLRNWPWHNTLCAPPEVSHGFVSSPASDVWQLGVLFLQMALREDFEGRKAASSAEAVLEMIGRVEDRRLRTLLKKMLAIKPSQRMGVQKILPELVRLKKKDRQFSDQIQPDIASSRKFHLLKINIFCDHLMISPQQTEIAGQQFPKEKVSLFLYHFFFQQSSSVIIRHKNRRVKDVYLHLVILQSYRKQLEDYLESLPQQVGLHLQKDGILEIIFPIPIDINLPPPTPFWTSSNSQSPNKKLILNQKYLNGNIGNLKQGGKINLFTRGLLLAESLILSVVTNLYDSVSKKSKSRLTYQSQQINSAEIEKCFFPIAYKNDKINPQNCYCLMKTTKLVPKSCLFFKRLIKNYRQDIIDKLAIAENISYNYQMGTFPFQKEEIEFDSKAHTFQLKNKYNFVRGEPLILNFSNNTFAVLGLHMSEGMGITFDGLFFERIYQWMSDCYVINKEGMSDFAFAVIQCANFVVEKQEILYLSNKDHYNLINSNPSERSTIIYRIQENSQAGNLTSEFGQLLFDSRIVHFQSKDFNAVRKSCQKAEQIMESIYKLPICTIAININLASQLFFRNIHLRDGSRFVDREVRNECYALLTKCINLLERYQLSPILLAQAYYFAAFILNEAPRSVQLHEKCSLVCRQLRHHDLLNKNILQLIINYEVANQHIQQICQQYEETLLQTPLGNSPTDRLQHLKIKMELLRPAKKYGMINHCVGQLLELAHSHFYDDCLRSKQVKDIWTSYLVEVMHVYVVPLNILLEFQQLLVKYDQDSYVKLKDSFRQKEELIKKADKRIALLMQRINQGQQ